LLRGFLAETQGVSALRASGAPNRFPHKATKTQRASLWPQAKPFFFVALCLCVDRSAALPRNLACGPFPPRSLRETGKRGTARDVGQKAAFLHAPRLTACLHATGPRPHCAFCRRWRGGVIFGAGQCLIVSNTGGGDAVTRPAGSASRTPAARGRRSRHWPSCDSRAPRRPRSGAMPCRRSRGSRRPSGRPRTWGRAGRWRR